MKAGQIKHGGLYQRKDTKQYLVAIKDGDRIKMLGTDDLRIQYYGTLDETRLLRNDNLVYIDQLNMNLQYGLTGTSATQIILDDPTLYFNKVEEDCSKFIINNEEPSKLTGEAWDRFVAKMECEPKHSDMMEAFNKKEEQND